MYLIDKLPALCPEGEVEFTPDLDGLIRWLETKEPTLTYVWMDSDSCVGTQFCRALGMKEPESIFTHHDALREHYYVLKGDCPFQRQTYSAALSRARAARAKG